MNASRRLQLELMEERIVPSSTIYDNPWLDGQHLTVSLAPDGTSISGQSSSLTQVLTAAGSNGEQALLQAFQTWADVANINFGLVGDGGEAFGVGKAIQGDPRFGDIRVGAVPLSSDVVAITSPFNYFDTYSGDMVLNSAQPIGTTYDLYTVALHEVGHALGLPDSTDPTSVMYDSYVGPRTGLSASDIADIQALYGARPADTVNNGTMTTAAAYNSPVTGELNQPGDTDYYKFNTGLSLLGTTIHLQAEGLSLLDARVSVFDSRGGLVASETATDPTNNDITLDLNNLGLLSNYYVRVDSPSGGVFDVGTYELTIQNNLVGAVGDLLNGAVGLLNGVGNSLLNATQLVPQSVTLDAEVNYSARASLRVNASTDMYQIQAPLASSGVTENLVATVWSLNNPTLAPRVEVLDSSGNPVAAEILTNDDGGSTIQVENALPGQTYYLEVTSASGQTGNYAMAVEFRSDAIEFPMNAGGNLGANTPTVSGTLVVQQSGVMHLVLSGVATSSNSGATVTMTIEDCNGNVVGVLTTSAGDAESMDLYLPTGTYSVTVSESTTNSNPLPTLPFQLSAIEITDPIAAQPADPTSNPDPGSSSPPPSSTGTSSSPPPSSSTGSSTPPDGSGTSTTPPSSSTGSSTPPDGSGTSSPPPSSSTSSSQPPSSSTSSSPPPSSSGTSSPPPSSDTGSGTPPPPPPSDSSADPSSYWYGTTPSDQSQWS